MHSTHRTVRLPVLVECRLAPPESFTKNQQLTITTSKKHRLGLVNDRRWTSRMIHRPAGAWISFFYLLDFFVYTFTTAHYCDAGRHSGFVFVSIAL
jgi:hypothetical protein